MCRMAEVRVSGLIAHTLGKTGQADTLVVYVHESIDPEHERNLHFFARHGIRRGDGCDYLIVIQQAGLLPFPISTSSLQLFPTANLHSPYSFSCIDMGTCKSGNAAHLKV